MKKRRTTKGSEVAAGSNGEAKFPYTNKPGSLRRLLTEIPKKPKPQKFDLQLLRSWGFTDGNDYSMLRVLKALGLLGSNNEPTELYTQFMSIDAGPVALAEPIRRLYAPLFTASHTPHKESDEKLRNLFHIHSSGEGTLKLQIQTFKALCDSADFETTIPPAFNRLNGNPAALTAGNNSGSSQGGVPIQINVHIHLPENKSKSDYQSIIEDIGRYIFRHDPTKAMSENE